MGEPPVFKDKISTIFFFSQGVGDTGTGGAGSRAMGKHSFFAFRLVVVRLWESMFSQQWSASCEIRPYSSWRFDCEKAGHSI